MLTSIQRLLLPRRHSNHRGAQPAAKPETPGNHVLDELIAAPVMPKILAFALEEHTGEALVLMGEAEARFAPVVEILKTRSRRAEWRAFRWAEGAANVPEEGRVVLCALPQSAEDWGVVTELKRKLGVRLLLLTELLLPFTRISFLQTCLHYDRPDLAAILPFYLGEKKFGPLDKLDAIFPLRGLSLIEFGPFDGCQTAGLVHLGVKSVTCVEARAENATKTRTALEVFGWDHVRVVMDDFHNADGVKYGRFDLAFCHGVYYHSIAPFTLLENLRTLSDRIFVGGFCATDESPSSAWLELKHEGRAYRAKTYREKNQYTAGINKVAYFFHADDLVRFFSERGYKIEMVSDESKDVTAGRYIRFLATKTE